MTKKISKKKKGFIIEIDEKIMNALGIDEKTELDLIVLGDELIIKPKVNKSSNAQKRKTLQKEERTNHILDKYGPLFKKLSKT